MERASWRLQGSVRRLGRAGATRERRGLEADYRVAWQKLLELALADLRDGRDALTARSALGAVVLAKGHLKLGAWLAFADESEIDEDLEEKAAWSDLYR